ncbi:glycosyltransferase [Actimicrobium antarcticum]|uniref:glycosyltransferase n=1 Tax=Actimicrobium antarcticum TaxID=1051899 RepID=UPI0031D618E9
MKKVSVKVSILIPSYNHALFLEEAIRSVWAQDYPDMELVVVDDGSVDDSRDILARLMKLSPIPMKVIEQSNAGICRSLNVALKESSGEIIGVLASDDIMALHRLKDEVSYFDTNLQLKVMFSNGQFQLNEKRFGNLHKPIQPFLERGVTAMRDHLLSTAPGFYSQARLIRRNFLIDLGGFDEQTGSDDWSLHIRIFQSLKLKKEFMFFDRVSFYYRVHSSQVHKMSTFMTTMKRKVIRRFFSLENRSKAVCEEYIKRAILLICKKQFSLGWRYLRLVIKISFANNVPWLCLCDFGLRMPGYLLRILKHNR